MANLYKIVFIGVEQIGYLPEPETSRRPVTSIFQTYTWAETSLVAIHEIKLKCKKDGIEIKDFTKISLVVSQRAIGKLMKEPLE